MIFHPESENHGRVLAWQYKCCSPRNSHIRRRSRARRYHPRREVAPTHTGDREGLTRDHAQYVIPDSRRIHTGSTASRSRFGPHPLSASFGTMGRARPRHRGRAHEPTGEHDRAPLIHPNDRSDRSRSPNASTRPRTAPTGSTAPSGRLQPRPGKT